MLSLVLILSACIIQCDFQIVQYFFLQLHPEKHRENQKIIRLKVYSAIFSGPTSHVGCTFTAWLLSVET